MIEKKHEIFEYGIKIFRDQFALRNRENWIELMDRQDGYTKAAKQFYLASGYLTPTEIENLFERNLIPEWMINIFHRIENESFGQSLVDYR